MNIEHWTVPNGAVALSVSRGGHGRPLFLCPGLLTTRRELGELIALLRQEYDVVSFDLRGHSASSPGARYTFEAFLGDLVAVLAQLPGRGLVSPVLVGYSLGADLAVHYAARYPGAVAELVLVDGANPLPEPFIGPADLAEFRAMAADSVSGSVLLTAAEVFELNLEIDVIRADILDRYRAIDCPISMIMSTTIAGETGVRRAARHNRLWRAGIERLLRARPDIAVSWLDADHRLVCTHPADIARLIRNTAATG
ncbi:alpha/beta fold hydrolase [Nocardia brasiliensis]|uniref:alpha/beta fold hydrolase n=1 Tax=Nocardia brasiliensis TaxID=37326 RepID=UPI0024544B76|nr:alpha/beta fold hydrolase [Nocardia brasiliensis]